MNKLFLLLGIWEYFSLIIADIPGFFRGNVRKNHSKLCEQKFCNFIGYLNKVK